ncbi:MAG TPA: Gmad2 immunoglobulin-like domain-containing protein, partial [Acidimicrobiia bacterium]
RFLLEGAPLDVLGGEGLIIDQPQTRASWADLTPPILVEEPMWGSTRGSDLTFAGIADLESGTVSFVVVDGDGLIIHEGEISGTPGEAVDFSEPVNLDEIPHPGAGSIIAWEWAPDGSQRHVVEYPLTLLAKG